MKSLGSLLGCRVFDQHADRRRIASHDRVVAPADVPLVAARACFGDRRAVCRDDLSAILVVSIHDVGETGIFHRDDPDRLWVCSYSSFFAQPRSVLSDQFLRGGLYVRASLFAAIFRRSAERDMVQPHRSRDVSIPDGTVLRILVVSGCALVFPKRADEPPKAGSEATVYRRRGDGHRRCARPLSGADRYGEQTV